MRIALDAMGGDNAPSETVAGAVEAAREYGIEIVLVGKPEAIKAELAKADTSGLNLPIEPAASAFGAEVTVKQVGIALYGPYLLAVELASMLLLGALVAAYHVAQADQ